MLIENHDIYDKVTASQNFFFRSMAGACFEREGILACSIGNNAFWNNVLHTQLTPEALQNIIPDVEAFFARQNLPWTWIVFPFSEPSNLGSILQNNGMEVIEEFTVMGRDMLEELPGKRTSSGNICEVKSTKDFDNWSLVLQEGFVSTEEITTQFRKRTELIPYGDGNNFHHYVYYNEDIPIATATISCYSNNVRIDNIAVRPKYQRQGFGTAITLHALQEAISLGAKHCFLDSSFDGKEIYKRLGFKEYYTGQIYQKAD